MFVFVCFVEEEEEENDLQNRSLTPYPFVCPEFWQHYNYLKEFHDWHTGAVHLQQQSQSDITPVNSTHVAHVLNTIDEEEAIEDDKLYKTAEAASNGKRNASNSECEVTVTITLPTKKEAMTRQLERETENSPVDFWQQINGGGREDQAAATSAETTTEESCNGSSSEDETPAYYLLDKSVGDGHHSKRDKDADSGITTLSVDVSRQASEKKVYHGSKKYKRTCTHSRLFDFLQHDDGGCNGKLQQSSSSTGGVDVPSSCTSGYSSAATTPSTSSVGCRGKYESDSGQMEYDNYYKSWEHACPYFGYDILPSKAFKTIQQQQQQQQGDGTVQVKPSTTVKFKCPKIPIAENES